MRVRVMKYAVHIALLRPVQINHLSGALAMYVQRSDGHRWVYFDLEMYTKTNIEKNNLWSQSGVEVSTFIAER